MVLVMEQQVAQPIVYMLAPHSGDTLLAPSFELEFLGGPRQATKAVFLVKQTNIWVRLLLYICAQIHFLQLMHMEARSPFAFQPENEFCPNKPWANKASLPTKPLSFNGRLPDWFVPKVKSWSQKFDPLCNSMTIY